MSLALAIDQIQRPTWWHENERDQSRAKHVSPEVIAKRAEILEWLRSQKPRKVEAKEMQIKFNLTNAQFWHIATPLVDAGQIRKYKPRHDKSLPEAV